MNTAYEQFLATERDARQHIVRAISVMKCGDLRTCDGPSSANDTTPESIARAGRELVEIDRVISRAGY